MSTPPDQADGEQHPTTAPVQHRAQQPPSAAPSASNIISHDTPVQNVRKSARLRAKREKSSQQCLVANESRHSNAIPNSPVSPRRTSAAPPAAPSAQSSKPRRKSVRASKKNERKPSEHTAPEPLTSTEKRKLHGQHQSNVHNPSPQPSGTGSPHDPSNCHATPEASQVISDSAAAVAERDLQENGPGKPRTEQNRTKPCSHVVSPVTPAENSHAGKRSLNLSADARSSSSEEEIRIARRQKRPRRAGYASQTGPATQLRSSEQNAIDQHDPVQSLDFDKLCSGSDSAKEKPEDAMSRRVEDAQTEPSSPPPASVNTKTQRYGTTHGEQSVSRRSKGSSRRPRRSWAVESDDDENTIVLVGEESAIDLRDENNASVDSIEAGFHFFLQRMGGEPSESDIRGLIKALGGAVDSDSDQDPGTDKNARDPREDSDCEEHSPILLDDDAAQFGEGGAHISYYEDHKDAEDRDLLTQYLQNQGARVESQRIQREKEPDAFSIPAPSSPIVLRNLIPPELAVPERASTIPKTMGNRADDQLCESTLDATEWILGAENFIGWNEMEVVNETRKLSNTNFRQIWSALFESRALGKLAEAGGLSDAETRTITGICARLLACDPDVDVVSVLAKELIDLRKEQSDCGFDSLAVVLAAKDSGNVPFRHKAIAGIWTAAIRRATEVGGHDEAWRLINKALELWFVELLEEKKVVKGNALTDENKMVEVFVSGLKMISMMFAVRLDTEEGALSTGESNVSPLCPENWAVICNCIERLSKRIARSSDAARLEKVLLRFIKSFSVHMTGRLWPVTENVVMATSKAVLCVSKARKQNCFCCSKTVTVASRFASLSLMSDGSRLESELKTGCDCLLYLGWHYARDGGGNVMKRAMSVIKNAAPFTRGRVDSDGSCSCAVNHHVGVLLTVADGLCSSSKNGEYLFCRMLTSKCPSLQKVAEHVAKNGGDNDLGWSAVMEAICIRCKVLLAQGKEVSVYMEWLSENVVTNLMVMRKCAERRSVESGTREVLRVQDSIFSSLAVRTFETVSKVARDLSRKVREDGAVAVGMASRALGKWWNHVDTLSRFGLEVLGQIEAHGAEWMAKKRHLVASGLMELIEEQMILGSEVRRVEKECGQDGVASEVRGKVEAVEAVAMGAMQVKSMNEEKWGREMRQRGASVMGMVMVFGWMEGSGKSEEVRLQEAMERVERCKVSDTGADGGGEFDERAVMGFWERSMWEEWGRLAAERRMEVRRVCTRCVFWGLASEDSGWEEEERVRLKGLCRRLGQMAGLEGAMGALGEVELGAAGREVDGEGRNAKVRGMEKAMAELRGVGWEVIGDVVEVVEGVGRRCEERMKGGRREKAELQEAVTMLGLCVAEKAELRGGFGGGGGGWAVRWMEGICEGVGRMRNLGGELSSTEAMQRHLMRALSTTGREWAVEAAVAVVRVLEAVDERDELRGMWARCEGSARRRRTGDEWRAFALHAGVEEVLFGRRAGGGGAALRRLHAAVRARVPHACDALRRVRQIGRG